MLTGKTVSGPPETPMSLDEVFVTTVSLSVDESPLEEFSVPDFSHSLGSLLSQSGLV